MSTGIIIAIDGYSACGKSTLAKALAAVLDYVYIDTGAMYRAVTLYCLRHQVALDDPQAVAAALAAIQVGFAVKDGATVTLLNGEDVEAEIRQLYVANHVSKVAEVSAVRRFLVEQQQHMGAAKRCVMDGRDIGTVVFPDAELKIFLNAHPDERARRRIRELAAKGQAADPAAIAANLQERDHIDSTRADSPLRQADDAVLIDNTVLTPEEQLAMVTALARLREQRGK